MNINVKKFINGPFDMDLMTTRIDGEMYFVASSVAKSLGYEKPRNAISTHVWDENKIKIHIDKMAVFGDAPEQGGVSIKNINSDYVLINEPGLYQLIFGSQLEKAREFQRWVYTVVLPELRKNGAFIDVQPNDTSEILESKAQLALEEANKKLEEMSDRLRYEEEANKVDAEEMNNLIARNDYLEDENSELFDSVMRLKKIVKYFLDRDKKEFIIRNDIREVPTDTIKYKKFLQDITNRLVGREPIYKDVRVPDYYDREEDFYA